MHIAVVAKGELPAGFSAEIERILSNVALIIAADGGLMHCQALGRWPDLLVGDLDSAPAELVAEAGAQGVQVIEHPADKDATDLDLALAEAVAAGATSVTVVAPFGGRLDHELATIGLLAGSQWQDVTIAATDGRRWLWIVRDELRLSLDPGTTLSLLPWAGDVTGLSITGVRWPLDDATLRPGSTLGVSNVAVAGDQAISLRSGTLLAIVDPL